MISLCKIATVALALAAAPGAHAQTTGSAVPGNIAQITNKYQALQFPASQITLYNGPLIVAGLGPYKTIIDGLNDISKTQNIQSQQMSRTQGANADSVFSAYSDLARVSTAFYSILTSKAGLFTNAPYIGYPVVTALRNVATGQEIYEYTLEQLAPKRKADLAAQGAQISNAIAAAIEAYSGDGVAKREAEQEEVAGPISRIKRGSVVVA